MGLLDALKGALGGGPSHGEVPVPGEARLTLPAGRLKVTYEEAVYVEGARGGIGVPDELTVTLTDAGGERVPFEVARLGGGGTKSHPARSWKKWGHFEVPSEGTYTLEVGPAVADRDDPKLRLSG